mmetsp:Transcript_74032/g.200228  ORF Transcript_74032/g.200228 Transcript_74032/m.200228 type:complete len:576 (+) Transcript_74032:113-1840(+)
MAQWYEHKMLPATLKLRRTSDTQFATIPQYFPSPLVPFKSPPVNQKPPAPAPAPAPKNAGAALLAQLQAGGKTASEQASAATAGSAHPPAGTPPQPKTQGKGKDGKTAAKGQGKAGAAEQGKGKSSKDNNSASAEKEAGPIGSGKAKAKAKAKEQRQQEPSWDGWDWSSWDWNSWNGWGGDAGGGDWQGSDGKQGGAEWKGAQGDPAAAGAKEKEKNGVQAAFGNLKWGPCTDASDLFPEDPTRKILDEGIVWEEQWVSPLLVRFSQGKIHPFFHERGPISEVMLQIKVRKQDQNKEQGQLRRVEAPFPPVRLLHLREQGVLVTLDNRRLYALQRFALQEWPAICLVKSLCVTELTPTRLRAENRKFTNRLCGLQLEIESRSNAFDTFSWVTEAAHAEAPRFFRPAFLKATDKAVSLLPVLVVHTLLCPSMLPFLRSRWPLIQYLAKVLRDPRARRFPSKRLLLHHVMQLAQPSRKAHLCPQLCIGYKSETVVTLSKGKSCVKSVLSVTKPLRLLESANSPVSDVQRQVLMALLPMLCLPYARIALKGSVRDCVVTLLIAWGKISAATLQLPQGP